MTHLLQIYEPGQTPGPHEDETLAIGIDLGTTHSVVAYADNGTATILNIGDKGPLVPSVVNGTLSSFKRFMGEVGKIFTTGHQTISPTEASAEILKFLKKRTEALLGKPVTKAVITVPAYFSETARAATRDAARLAGLEVLRLINEPTAAALAYGLDRRTEGLYLVYDFGGGTFDVTILKLHQGVFQVLSTAGDLHLGGDDIDQIIAERISQDLLYARRVKEFLSTHATQNWVDNEKQLTFSQEDFQICVRPFVERTLKICKQALHDADIDDLSLFEEIILVGGSSRLPHAWETLRHFFGKEPLCSLNPDEVVAMGAALQAEALTKGASHLLLDVTPLSLGLETMGGFVEKIISRNTPIPCSVTQEFTTHHDGQTSLSIHILQGEKENVQDCRSLGQFILSNIPHLPAGTARIRVTFSLDADGLLTVTAREQTTGHQKVMEVNQSHGLDEEKILSILKKSFD
jgi:molecular chaperone HscA